MIAGIVRLLTGRKIEKDESYVCSMLGSSAVMEGGIKQNNGLDIYQACSTVLHCILILWSGILSARGRSNREPRHGQSGPSLELGHRPHCSTAGRR